MHFKHIALSFLIGLATVNTSEVLASEPDSTKTESQNSAIFLNASSDDKPREVSLGLPTNNLSAVPIFEDGLPVSYYIYQFFPYKSWHGGVSAEKTSTIGPMSTALLYGEVGNYVYSINRKDAWEINEINDAVLHGALSASFNNYGQIKADFNLNGNLGNDWGYSASAYINRDRGSNHTDYPYLRDEHQFYKGVISKHFGRFCENHMSLTYQHVKFTTFQENYGPFTFVGDGSVKVLDGFDLGTDSYWPNLRSYSFMDFKTGEMQTRGMKNGNRDRTDHITYLLSCSIADYMYLTFRSRLKTGTSNRGSSTLAGIEHITDAANYSFEDGSPFTGDLQRRSILCYDAKGTSWMNSVRFDIDHFKRFEEEPVSLMYKNTISLKLDYFYNQQDVTVSSVNFAHEVKPNPQLLYFRGDSFYNFNTSGEYYNGHENKWAATLFDTWDIKPTTTLRGFVRAEHLAIHGRSANNKDGDTSNTRRPGFNLTQGKITPFSEKFLNGAIGISFKSKICRGLSFMTEGVMTRTNRNLFSYGGYLDPPTTPTDTKYATIGLTYANRWINIVSQLLYINQSNINSRTSFQHALQKETAGYPVGYIETKVQPVNYDIESLGWTTDALITPFKGFTMHMQLTLRNPLYRNYKFTPTFSDGVTEVYDFSGNNVTNLHKTELTLEPSYKFDRWRFWLTARYISKQYINKTNSLHFNGRWETFAGIDYKISNDSRLSLNIINLLNQKGASGTIGSADLVEDASGYTNYLMSGTFIRPLTIELGYSMDF